ncbi:MAG TPA: 2OG-Fe(II) oxygenase [Arachnia sp.]|nr:2OG-Fe(II) oxygenase [Arachnia sp.]HMR12419.1 2OG-Fe(II) oxygenase [Arachnia sp.]
MATTPRDRLARLLAGQQASTSDSASAQLPADVLELSIDGIGRVPLPLRPAQARALKGVARPAHFGRGEETLLDPSVRDTWEIDPQSVILGGARWDAALTEALEELGVQLGIPGSSRLRPELHSMLVYGKGQFFAPHQDSEKHDDMVATLVVALPSPHTGGQLVIDDRGSLKHYDGSPEKLVLVAFYADRRHEVLPVRTGTRVTLTFNLLLESDPTPVAGGPVEQAASLLAHHFSTPVRRPYEKESHLPARLAFLLDHEYSERGLSAGKLKGTDAERVALLGAAADAAGCEWVLAATEIQETWNAIPDTSYRPYGYDDYDDPFGEETDPDDEPDFDDLDQLIDGSTVLTWWSDPKAKGEIGLSLENDEVCAVTPSRLLKPYSSEYEGYMGNYGNTVDRWYRRAAVVLWPRENGFRNRAEANPSWALDTVVSSIADGDLERAREDALTLTQVWRPSDDALATALLVAHGVDDATIATAVLEPFSLTLLTADDAEALAALWDRYPADWWATLRERWEGQHRYRDLQMREWAARELAALGQGLRAHGAAGVVAWIADWLWADLRKAIDSWLAHRNVGQRELRLTEFGPAVAVVLAVADDDSALTVGHELADVAQSSLPLLMATLHESVTPCSPALAVVADAARGHLADLLAQPERADDDWSIAWTSPGGADPDRLAAFLQSADERVLEWPLAQARRQTIHRLIDDAGLPVTHVTRRTGSPFTLVLRKTKDLFEREADARRRAEADLAWLVAR